MMHKWKPNKCTIFAAGIQFHAIILKIYWTPLSSRQKPTQQWQILLFSHSNLLQAISNAFANTSCKYKKVYEKKKETF